MKASEYVDWLKLQAALKRPYWYGTCGYQCTDSLLRSKAKQYPAHYGASRTARYRKDIAAGQICGDCVGGAIKWAVWSGLGTHKNVYKSGGCPDTSADGMFAYCKNQGMAWGEIGTLPEQPGVALRRSGHVGVYIGDGKAVEWRGFNYGCVVTQVAGRGWTHWYRMPWVEYGEDAVPAGGTALLGSRLLKRGAKGNDVVLLQQALNDLAFNAGEVDGIYGSRTEAAVRRMQQVAGISDDGQYGSQSHAALMAMLSESDNGEDIPDEPVQAARVRVTGGRVNVRSGAGTQNAILTVVTKGTELPYTAQSDNGWFAVRLADGEGWISGKYAEKVQ
ncbi:MAG: peptidoglycan-binding protein [Clostridia bacterium]|nr:peptidoglycan-binding protein [Clostridia bacterium]